MVIHLVRSGRCNRTYCRTNRGPKRVSSLQLLGTAVARAIAVADNPNMTHVYSKTGQICPKKQRRPVLRPDFAVEHAELLGFDSPGPLRALVGALKFNLTWSS